MNKVDVLRVYNVLSGHAGKLGFKQKTYLIILLNSMKGIR